jgi:hypothetical protein
MRSSPLTRPLSLPLVVGLTGGLAVTLFWLWVTAAGSASPQKPHHVPVAAIGPVAAVARLADGLGAGGAFHLVTASSEAKAIDLVQHRKVDAVVNLDTQQLQTVHAASMLTATALPQVLSSPQSGLHLQTIDIKPSAPGDPTGLGLMFICLACVLGGLPSGVALAFLSKNRRPVSLAEAASRVVLIIVFSAIMALFIALVADGVLGYGGSAILTVWAWATMLCIASMGTATALIAALGIPGVLVAAIPLLFFGVAAAPEPSPWNWQAGIFRTLGPYDAFGATTNGILNGIFFAPATQTKNLLVLAIWIAVPVLILFLLGWRSQRTSTPSRALRADVGDLQDVDGMRPVVTAQGEGRTMNEPISDVLAPGPRRPAGA